MKGFKHIYIIGFLLFLNTATGLFADVIVEPIPGDPKCVDKNAESPAQNVSKSAIGELFDTFADVNFCKDQFLTKNDFTGFCECEKEETLNSVDIKKVSKGIIEREALSNALSKNKEPNYQNKIDILLTKLVDLKLELPRSCQNILDNQAKLKSDCQNNKDRWDILKSLSKSENPLSQLDSDINRYKARKTIQDILKNENNRDGFSFLLGQSVKSQFSAMTGTFANQQSLGLSLSSQIGLLVEKSFEFSINIGTEEILADFLKPKDNEDYSTYVLSNASVGSGAESIIEQRRLTAEILPLFREKGFKLAFAASVDEYIKAKSLESQELSNADFQNIFMRTFDKVVDDNRVASAEAEAGCFIMLQSSKYACEENDFKNLEISPELYRKHLSAFFPSRVAGKMACLEAKNAKLPWVNDSISQYFNVENAIAENTVNISRNTKNTSALDKIIDPLDPSYSSTTQQANVGGIASQNYQQVKKNAARRRVVVSSGGVSQKRYAAALASGDKSKIKEASKRLENEIKDIKKETKRVSQKEYSNSNFDDDITKIMSDDSKVEMDKIEDMIKKNEELYALNDKDKNEDNEFASQFNEINKFNKNNQQEFSPGDFISPLNIEPEPIKEEELNEEDKDKFDGAKSKLDGLIEKYETLIEKQEREKKEKESSGKSKKKEVDDRIAKLQGSIEDLKNQRSKLLGKVETEKTPTKNVFATATPTPSTNRVARKKSSQNNNSKKSTRVKESGSYSTNESSNRTPASLGSTSLEKAPSGSKTYESAKSSGSAYSGVSMKAAPVIKLRTTDMVINGSDFNEYSKSDFDAYFARFGSEPLVVKKQIEVTLNGVKSYEEVLEYYFPEVDSGKITYVKRNPELVRQAISNVMARNNLDKEIDLTLRTVAKHSELIQLFDRE